MSKENFPILASMEFADALSEPFRPATDLAEGTHTMARLARATREKGLQDSGRADVLGAWKYQPSWGGGAIATAYFFRPTTQEIEVLAGVSVEADQTSLRIGNGSVYHIPGVANTADLNLRAETETLVLEHKYDLALGEKLSAARLVIAQYAQDFFDQLA
jgi:hypothetical protein